VTRSPTVLYIAGLGRSGSTLLDLLLGELDGYVSTGELRGLWRYGLGEGWTCGCREPIRSCPFWRPVLERSGLDGADPGIIDDIQRRYLRLRPRALTRLWLAHRLGTPLPGPLATYAETMTSLYRAASDVSGDRIVIDSSKWPQDALLLMQAPVNLFVVHLVRDPRGNANSWLWKRDNIADPTGRGSQVLHPFFTGARWIAWHGTIEVLLRRSLNDRYLRLSYEEFAQDPAGAIARVTSMVEGEARDSSGFLRGSRAMLGPNHTAYGNRSRYRIGEVAVRFDDGWREQMSTRDKLWATLPTLPLLKAYGYPVMPPGRSSQGPAKQRQPDGQQREAHGNGVGPAGEDDAAAVPEQKQRDL
jgi:hypothetical protein